MQCASVDSNAFQVLRINAKKNPICPFDQISLPSHAQAVQEVALEIAQEVDQEVALQVALAAPLSQKVQEEQTLTRHSRHNQPVFPLSLCVSHLHPSPTTLFFFLSAMYRTRFLGGLKSLPQKHSRSDSEKGLEGFAPAGVWEEFSGGGEGERPLLFYIV